MSTTAEPHLGLSGAIAKKFLLSEITPLLALVGLLMGVFAVLITPREEEPQINVTFANVFIPFPGATSLEVERLVSSPAEQMLAEIEGVEHVYSVSRPGMAVLTVQFLVGQPRTDAIVRLYNKLYSNADWLPSNLGVGQPILKPKGIDDVPIVSLTLWTEDSQRSAEDLTRVAHTLETELKRVPGTRDLYTIGAPDRVVRVLFDPAKLAGYGLSLTDLRRSLQAANASVDAGALVSDNREIPVQAGSFLVNAEEIGALVVGLHQGTPVYLADVAEVKLSSDQPKRYVWLGTGPAAAANGIKAEGEFPAVTLAIAKKPGENAVVIADQIIERVEQLKGILIPEGVNVTVTRNYGVTANEKAMTLIAKLIFATSLVILLVLLNGFFVAAGRVAGYNTGFVAARAQAQISREATFFKGKWLVVAIQVALYIAVGVHILNAGAQVFIGITGNVRVGAGIDNIDNRGGYTAFMGRNIPAEMQVGVVLPVVVVAQRIVVRKLLSVEDIGTAKGNFVADTNDKTGCYLKAQFNTGARHKSCFE